MRNKNTAYYRGNVEVSVDFSANEISPDGAVVLLEKLERKHQPISYFNGHIKDRRDPLRTVHSIEKLLKQRVFTFIWSRINSFR
ncbi:transposase [Fulvivirga sediminis]|uniref:Transposase n=1 Tax=Fulvivirga sediminis TaxID=2803949 RepID=A0A937K181_9BACT|nr:transposase [Fulvivirga sediminis]